VFAKHLRSFWLIDSLAIGVDRMKRNFGPMQKKGRKGGALERRELTVVVTAEVDCFRSADQLGTTPFVDTRASLGTFLVRLPTSRLLVTYRISVSALAIMHSPRSADSDCREAAVDRQLHPIHEARIV
jgi:hypothetical protein